MADPTSKPSRHKLALTPERPPAAELIHQRPEVADIGLVGRMGWLAVMSA